MLFKYDIEIPLEAYGDGYSSCPTIDVELLYKVIKILSLFREAGYIMYFNNLTTRDYKRYLKKWDKKHKKIIEDLQYISIGNDLEELKPLPEPWRVLHVAYHEAGDGQIVWKYFGLKDYNFSGLAFDDLDSSVLS